MQIRPVAIHAEDAFGDDDDSVIGGMMLFQQPFQLRQIIVAVTDTFGRRKTDAVNQTGVDELVGHNHRTRLSERRNEPRISVIAAVEEQSRASVETFEKCLEAGVVGLMSRQQAGGRGR